MKTILLLGIFLVSTSAEAQTSVSSQRAQEDIEIKIPASEFNAETFFHMKNINGDLNAEGYDGDEIIITGTKIVTSKPRLIGDFNPDEIYLDRLDGDNSIFIFVRQPGMEVKIEGDKLHYNYQRRKKNRYGDDDRLNFEFNLQLKIPHYLMSEISTINGGEVVVTGMTTGVKANNVNGSVFVNDAAGKVDANTVNGNIRVEFAEAPEQDSEFHTVNGTIEVYAPKNLSAVVTFKSLHGELYTDFNNIEYLPNRVNKSQDGTTRYSIEQTSPIQIGEGGPELRFRLLNGNAYIKQRKS
ncbi:DUF4097 family beta strand repeat-containing protein [Gracilimonas sp.]|uniref:DUF4097 family beta strand repeat-containing protein n=1 Tax=Gracilimonas sp. TaxID=1974203 RepID=UPI003D12E29C